MTSSGDPPQIERRRDPDDGERRESRERAAPSPTAGIVEPRRHLWCRPMEGALGTRHRGSAPPPEAARRAPGGPPGLRRSLGFGALPVRPPGRVTVFAGDLQPAPQEADRRRPPDGGLAIQIVSFPFCLHGSGYRSHRRPRPSSGRTDCCWLGRLRSHGAEKPRFFAEGLSKKVQMPGGGPTAGVPSAAGSRLTGSTPQRVPEADGVPIQRMGPRRWAFFTSLISQYRNPRRECPPNPRPSSRPPVPPVGRSPDRRTPRWSDRYTIRVGDDHGQANPASGSGAAHSPH